MEINMKGVYVKGEAHEERIEAMHLLIVRYNIAMFRMVDATIAVMRAHAIPVFNETCEELFDGFHRRFSGYVSEAARFLEEHLESYEFAYVEQKVENRDFFRRQEEALVEVVRFVRSHQTDRKGDCQHG